VIARRAVFGVSLVALLALPVMLGSVRTSGRIIIPADQTLGEDLYAIGTLILVEGTIDGDLFAVANEVRVSGTIRGDLIGLVGGPVRISGTVEGAVRVAATDLEVTGSVGDDLAAVVADATIAGDVGRDLLFVGGRARVAGTVGRDLRLQAVRLEIDGVVGSDVRARVDRLSVGGGAAIGGNLLYTGSREATIDGEAQIGGRATRRDVLAPVWARAVTRAIEILGVAALIVGGLGLLWLFPASSHRAVDEARSHPWWSALIGGIVLIGLPVLALPLFLTLVGIPVALLVLFLWALAVVLGPVPALAAAGGSALRGRGGIAAGLLVGVVVWRIGMWLLPLISGFLFLAAIVVGVGAFSRAGWRLRREGGFPGSGAPGLTSG
jgi:cytoskeletal protein CcmA (bactofilin family)